VNPPDNSYISDDDKRNPRNSHGVMRNNATTSEHPRLNWRTHEGGLPRFSQPYIGKGRMKSPHLRERCEVSASLRNGAVRFANGSGSGSVSHVFREQGIHIVADTVAEVVADDAYSIQPGD
jgi:hypothetical protein